MEAPQATLAPGTDLFAGALQSVQAVDDDPEGRYQLCETFYKRYGFGPGTGYGASELDFVRWEINRGVLNPLNATKPGSRWWRAVNRGLLSDAACAAAVVESGRDIPVTGPIAAWLSYLRAPSPQSWYRAHNASTVQGYLKNCDAARLETSAERTFMNIVLYRVLYAQALVEGDAPGLLGQIAGHVFHGMVSGLEKLFASPRSLSVDLLLHLPDFYPDHYEMTPQDELDILGRGHGAEAVAQVLLDRVLISPSLTQLYALAATWLDMPDLCALVVNHKPDYPNFNVTR